MLVFPLFKLLLLACTAGWSRTLGTTTNPNHLPEEKFSLLTSAPLLTTPEDSTRTSMVTTTVAPLLKTMAPTIQNSTKLSVSLTTPVPSPTPSFPQHTTTKATADFTSTTTPDLTTGKGNCYQKLKIVYRSTWQYSEFSVY